MRPRSSSCPRAPGCSTTRGSWSAGMSGLDSTVRRRTIVVKDGSRASGLTPGPRRAIMSTHQNPGRAGSSERVTAPYAWSGKVTSGF
jgi:hypothetical protein